MEGRVIERISSNNVMATALTSLLRNELHKSLRKLLHQGSR